MGRKGSGVEIRENSIRLRFTYEGKRHAETLMQNGKPMKPTPANLKYAERLAAQIKDRIRYGTFSVAECFSPRNFGGAWTVGTWLDRWLGTLNLALSTMYGYGNAISHWKKVSFDPDNTKRVLGDVPLRALRTSHITTAIALRKELAGKTINNYLSVLNSAIQSAVDDNMLSENPVKNVSRQSYQKDPTRLTTRKWREFVPRHARDIPNR